MILHRVTLFSAGLYSCEVSADFPDYDTEIRRQHMHVFGKQRLNMIMSLTLSWQGYKNDDFGRGGHSMAPPP